MKTATATEIRTFEDTLANGLTLVTVEMPHLHTLEIALFIRAGLRFENEQNNGISHFLEHMLFRGNRKYPDSIALNLEFEKIGRDVRASTHSEYTHFSFSPHYEQLERGMELFAEFFSEPTFPCIELEREIILEECLEDINAEGEDVEINNLACRLLYGQNPLALPIIGKEESIRRIDVAQLKTYFESKYSPENMILVGAGAISHDPFLAQAQRYFEPLPRRGTAITTNHFQGSVNEEQQKPALMIKKDVDSQAQLQICFRGVSYNDPDYFVLDLIERMFDDGVTSRLQKTLREAQGLAYSVECHATSLSDIGTIDFDVTARQEKVIPIAQVIFNEIKVFLEQGPRAEELEHVKKRYFFELDFDQDDLYKQMARYGFPHLYSKVITVEQEQAIIENITLEDIIRVAEKTFVAHKLNVVLVGPHTPQIVQELETLTRQF